METASVNTAATGVTSATASMSAEDWKREKVYMVTMRIFRGWLEQGLITAEEYSAIDTKMRSEYRPKFGGLWYGNDLIQFH